MQIHLLLPADVPVNHNHNLALIFLARLKKSSTFYQKPKTLAMKKLCLLVTFLSISTFSSFAQYYEAGIMLGGTNYMGDISPNGLAPSEYNLAFGLFGRYNLNRYVAFKASLFQGTLSGSDANNTLSSGLRQRNLSFRTSVMELAITNEFHLAPLEIRAGKISVPYVFAGIAGFYFNPQAEFRGNWVDLQPLGTEGQESINKSVNKYSRVSVAIPFGFGIKIAVNDKFNIGVEMGIRKTITDYIDDVSNRYPDIDHFQGVDPVAATLAYRTPEFYNAPMGNPSGEMRGNPNDQDWYFIGGITVSVNLANRKQLEWDKKYKKFEGMQDVD